MKWIDTVSGLDDVVNEVMACEVVGVDTEADSLHSYFEKVCLIQISTPSTDFLIDPLTVDPAPLGDSFSNPAIVKLFHGADYDLRITNRDFGFTTRSLVDTMVCAQLLGEEGWGLAALLKKYFDVDLDKRHQRADWAKRPLSASMAQYAAMDTRHLAALASELQQRLEARERWSWALEEFERLEAIRHEPEEDTERYRRLKGAGRLGRRGLAALERLWLWRDQIARNRDVPPFKVIGNDTLVGIAEALPRDIDALKSIKSMGAVHLSRYGPRISSILSEVQDLAEEELPERKSSTTWIRDKRTERCVERLKNARNAVAEELGVDPSILSPKHVLLAIATSGASQLDDLNAIPALRRWQKDVLGAKMLAELAASQA